MNSSGYKLSIETPLCIVGSEYSLSKIKEFAYKIRFSSAPILIRGETGTGKSHIAKYFFEQSARYNRKLVIIPLAEVPENLFESQLFGYERGAFTDAKNDFKGLIKSANGGTIIFEEIDAIPKYLQAKLLRLIEDKEFIRLGSTEKVKVDVRFIFTTNVNLKEQIEAGYFRKDLYYRINTIEFQIEPLYRRKEDVICFANHFLTSSSIQVKNKFKGFTDDAKEILKKQQWDGNVRELKSLIEKVITFSDSNQSMVSGDDLSCFLQIEPINIKKNLHLINNEEVYGLSEKEKILHLLAKNEYHRGKTAKDLGVSRKTLYNKLNKYGLSSNLDF